MDFGGRQDYQVVSGGSRPGAGRPSGKNWNGSGEYEKKVRISVGLPRELYLWLKADADRCGTTMTALVNEAIVALRVANQNQKWRCKMKYNSHEVLQQLKAETDYNELSPPPQKSQSEIAYPVEDCVCGGGTKYGHYNDAGGFCCPHYGDTCGFHSHCYD